MAHDQNWEKRQFVSFSPQFRIDVNNPQTGFNGPGIYDLYGYTENGDVSLSGMMAGGIYRLYNDRTIEIIGGANSERGGVDICITGMKGSVLITAQENGEVLIKGAKVTIEAKGDLNLKSGGNMKLDCGKKFDIKAQEAYCDAPHSYGPDCIATKTNETFLTRVYAGLAAESIAVAASVGAGGIGSKLAAGVMKEGINNLREGFGV